MGHVIVEFPDRREVFINDESQGDNRTEQGVYRILIVGDGLQTFRLGGLPNYTPLSQPVIVAGNSAVWPQHVVFHKNR